MQSRGIVVKKTIVSRKRFRNFFLEHILHSYCFSSINDEWEKSKWRIYLFRRLRCLKLNGAQKLIRSVEFQYTKFEFLEKFCEYSSSFLSLYHCETKQFQNKDTQQKTLNRNFYAPDFFNYCFCVYVSSKQIMKTKKKVMETKNMEKGRDSRH